MVFEDEDFSPSHTTTSSSSHDETSAHAHSVATSGRRGAGWRHQARAKRRHAGVPAPGYLSDSDESTRMSAEIRQVIQNVCAVSSVLCQVWCVKRAWRVYDVHNCVEMYG